MWPKVVTQTRIVHLLRNSFRYASRRYWTLARILNVSSQALPAPSARCRRLCASARITR